MTRPKSTSGYPMGWGEQGYSRLAIHGRSAAAILLCLTLHGPRIPRERIELGLLALQRKHWILRCHVDLASLHLRDDPPVSIPVVEVPRCNSSETWRRIYETYVGHMPTGPYRSPHSVFLVQDDAYGDRELVLCLQHFCGDGNSSLLLMHELVLYLQTEPPPLPPLETAPSPDGTSLVWAAAVAQRGRVGTVLGMLGYFVHVFSFFPPFSPAPLTLPLAVPCTRVESLAHHSTEIMSQRLSADETAAFVRACKLHRVSVTSAVAAALLFSFRAASREQQAQPLVVNYAAGLRPLLGVSDELATALTAGFYSRLGSNHDQIWEAAADLGAQTAANKDRLLCHALAIYLGMRALPTVAVQATMTLSSWAANSPLHKSYGPWSVVHGDLYQPSHFLAYPVVDVITIADKLTIVVMAQSPRFSHAVLQKALDLTMARLREMYVDEGGRAGGDPRSRL